jgi:hypothetical protein
LLCLLAVLIPGPLVGEDVPFASGEKLVYEITWPSGLGLGEVEFLAQSGTHGWQFSARVNATLPNLEVRDEYHAQADAALCSFEFQKEARHGSRIIEESVVFDQENHKALRKTRSGGESEFAVPPCARDGLTYLYFLRREMGRGRIPPPDDLNFGGQYQVTSTYAESREIVVGGKSQTADRLLIDLTGPASQRSFEVFFARDSARTPLLIRIPFELGTFSLKLSQ